MLSEQIGCQVLADRQGLIGRPGVQYADLPTVHEAVEAFSLALTAEPEQVDPRLRALGLVE
jgi:hypothetical protein